MDFMKLVSARKGGDAYEFEKDYTEKGFTAPVIIPARVNGACVTLSSPEMFNATIQITNSPLLKVESGEGVWISLGHAYIGTGYQEIPKCQAIRLRIESGHPKMEIYAS